MPGLANVHFSDIFATLNAGVPPQALASGTTSGNAVQLGGVSPLGKLLFRGIFSMTASNASGTATMFLQTAVASSGAWTSLSATVTSVAFGSANSANQFELRLDTRNEAFANIAATGSTAPLWVMPVVVTATSTVGFYLDVLGWEGGNDPESNYNGSTVSVTEVDFY